MGQVTATTTATISAPAAEVFAALSDYAEVRPAILTSHYRDYRVEKGGQGAGTRVHWILQATEKRQRDVLADVTVAGDRITETDRNSTMVTTFTVTSVGNDAQVQVVTTWKGAGGIGGFFEKTFAPKGLNRIYTEMFANLNARLAK